MRALHLPLLVAAVGLVPAPADPVPVGTAAELHLSDGGRLKATLLTAEFTIRTRFGSLTVPARDVKEITFATRLRPEDEETAKAAIGQLGHPDFQTREKASAALESLPAAALPLVRRAQKHTDPETARRADRAAGVIGVRAGAVRPADTVRTADGSTFVGEVTTATVEFTSVLGRHTARLCDLDSLSAVDPDADAVPAPPNMTTYAGKAGEYRLKVTGVISGGVWGDGKYTLDSNVSAAAVHAGVVEPNSSRTVRVRVTCPTGEVFVGVTKNGITSAPYPSYTAGHYEFLPR